MGSSYTVHCSKCGRHTTISEGAFFRSPAYADEILAGERGKQAKLNFERHPGKSAMFTYEVFVCSCGYTRSKLVMIIFDDDQTPWSIDPNRKIVWHNARCRCPLCGKNMRISDGAPYTFRCRCGEWIEDEPCEYVDFD